MRRVRMSSPPPSRGADSIASSASSSAVGPAPGDTSFARTSKRWCTSVSARSPNRRCRSVLVAAGSVIARPSATTPFAWSASPHRTRCARAIPIAASSSACAPNHACAIAASAPASPGSRSARSATATSSAAGVVTTSSERVSVVRSPRRRKASRSSGKCVADSHSTTTSSSVTVRDRPATSSATVAPRARTASSAHASATPRRRAAIAAVPVATRSESGTASEPSRRRSRRARCASVARTGTYRIRLASSRCEPPSTPLSASTSPPSAR